ncbi:Bis(5'-nucleosyl)-tetraphosphatase, symmetrical [Delftia tsuruhatensis]|uniref:symmetrical bis(5'-nucleosyl)-tetraphosphatase n=1 Tax=Delftia tsuruhatensis TaxID=180282 RepID=UPI001E6C9F9F|nr:symmetrical bis(5'-nucleosyl)-tetraphosphatase [Delftia tsuruhatensis]CAB5704391.1 Bis(5'-nucleosyl)-tetraphosphatase, symmetrical [Delftia tsuruhatensis]CAC9689759.1 Bis(5'-nucleosyl)-tetraphosphatase, symmetrical [Delftia tsuruhatensis]
MALYCIGDIQGCHDAFERLLRRVDFSASRDTLYVLGDLVNRGPDSDKVLRTCMAAGDSMRALLGNHDLHLLAAAHGERRNSRRDTLARMLQAPDRDGLLDWLRHQPLARSHRTALGDELLMVHAGVLPQWTSQEVMDLADEVHAVLRGARLPEFLKAMYGNQPDHWSPQLTGWERLRVIVNALTRLRFCTAQGTMDFDSAESADQAAPGLMPWFDVPGRATAGVPIAFGHWSTLGHVDRPDLVALDTGCVWGGCLSMMRFGDRLSDRELIQVDCPQAQVPG